MVQYYLDGYVPQIEYKVGEQLVTAKGNGI